jgi:hypothetical protein
MLRSLSLKCTRAARPGGVGPGVVACNGVIILFQRTIEEMV